jgi:hypothetical protein
VPLIRYCKQWSIHWQVKRIVGVSEEMRRLSRGWMGGKHENGRATKHRLTTGLRGPTATPHFAPWVVYLISVQTLRHTDVSMRCWLRSQYVDRPYKAPFELVGRKSTSHSYQRLMKKMRLLLFPSVEGKRESKTITSKKRFDRMPMPSPSLSVGGQYMVLVSCRGRAQD